MSACSVYFRQFCNIRAEAFNRTCGAVSVSSIIPLIVSTAFVNVACNVLQASFKTSERLRSYSALNVSSANLDYNNNSKVKSSIMNSENEISPKSKAIYDNMSKKKTNDSFMHLFKIQEMLKDYIKQFSKAITKDGE